MSWIDISANILFKVFLEQHVEFDFHFLFSHLYSISCNDKEYNVKYCDRLPGS